MRRFFFLWKSCFHCTMSRMAQNSYISQNTLLHNYHYQTGAPACLQDKVSSSGQPERRRWTTLSRIYYNSIIFYCGSVRSLGAGLEGSGVTSNELWHRIHSPARGSWLFSLGEITRDRASLRLRGALANEPLIRHK